MMVVIGCGPSPVASGFWEASDSNQWSEDDVVSIKFDISDSIQRYDLMTTVNHTTDFKFQNLYVEITNQTPDGDSLSTPVSLELADTKGQWQGICSGDQCEATIVLRENFYFRKNGTYRISLRPHMRVNPVGEISAVSLSLVKTSK